MKQGEARAYLARIGWQGEASATEATLRALHRAHMFSVPFENLDIGRGVPIVLDRGRLYDKLVTRRRGGFCYELNGLFAELLRALGYEVTLLSARVFDGGQPGPEYDHLVLRVAGGELGEAYLADVGFGASHVEPLRFVTEVEQSDPAGQFRLVEAEGAWQMQDRDETGAWQPQHAFSLTPRRLADFEAMCRYQQTSPQSHFTQKRICSRATPEGRLSLSDNRLIVTRHGQREEHVLETEAAVQAALRDHFGVALP
jgi:N-hydroxyarylamine O-acetyltransferase